RQSTSLFPYTTLFRSKFRVRHRHGRRDGDGVAGMHTHRIEVFDGANHAKVASAIADDFELVFLPAEETLFDEAFVDGALAKRPRSEEHTSELQSREKR